MKYLLWALLIYLAWRLYLASQQKRESSDADATEIAPPTPDRQGVEKMVRCAHCGIHLPASEALAAPGALHFCTESHRDQYSPSQTDTR